MAASMIGRSHRTARHYLKSVQCHSYADLCATWIEVKTAKLNIKLSKRLIAIAQTVHDGQISALNRAVWGHLLSPRIPMWNRMSVMSRMAH